MIFSVLGVHISRVDFFFVGFEASCVGVLILASSPLAVFVPVLLCSPMSNAYIPTDPIQVKA